MLKTAEWSTGAPLDPRPQPLPAPEPQADPSDKPAHRGHACIWLIKYREKGGKLETRITPPLPHPGAAIFWLYCQKPFILNNLKEVVVEPYRTLAVK